MAASDPPTQATAAPRDGDVLITTADGKHFLSVVPHPDRVSFDDLFLAIEIAMKWAKVNNASVWRKNHGKTSKLPLK